MTSSTAAPRHSWLLTRLFEPVDIALLIYFRVAFGLSMLYWVGKGWWNGLASMHYVQPRLHLSYYGFEWLQPLFGNGMYLVLAGMALCALFMVLGYCYRLSSVLFALGFSYLFLLDKSTYQNHYYLIFVISWIMAVLPANRALSIDAWQRPPIRSQTVPAWTLWLVRLQLGIPYFYGGLAKIDPDWLAGEPMRMALAQKTWYPWLGPLFGSEIGVQLWVWGGLLFDLLVVPALLWRRTRFPAYIVCLGFHIMNAFMWPIGIFPWFMILATAVFFEPDWPRKLFSGPNKTRGGDLNRRRIPTSSQVLLQPPNFGAIEKTRETFVWPQLSLARKVTVVLLSCYVGFQLLVPFRHYFNDGRDTWTEESHCFSWHMMLRSKSCGVRFYATDPRTGRTGNIDLRPYLTMFQANRFGRDPRMIHQLARYVADDLRRKGFPDVEIRALALVSLNGRKPQLMIDPEVDLGAEPVTWQRPDWILPLTEPLRDEPWDLPLAEWEQHLELPEHFVLAASRVSGE